MSLKTWLTDEIKSEMTELNKMELGSAEYQSTIDGVAKLADRVIELEKADADERAKELDSAFDRDYKRAQLKAEKTDNNLRNGIAIGSIIVTSIITVWGTITSFKFEETGHVVTTIMGKGFINKLLPRK